jgi:ribose transport system permease protein
MSMIVERTSDAPAPREGGGAGSWKRASAIIVQFGVVWAYLLLLILGSVAFPDLTDITNVKNLLSQSSPVGIIAVGMTFVMIGGGFDLSVGALFALGAVIFADKFDQFGLFGAGAIVLLVVTVCGMVNGFIVTKLRVNPFVATLGTGSAFGGLAYIYSNSAPITPMSPDYQALGTDSWLGWPVSVWLMLIIFAAGWFVLARTVYGQSIYAIGGNSEAARLSGLRVNLLRGSTYVLTALCSGIGGMILASRLAVGQADLGGSIALDAIAIVVVGGTSLLGGEGTMWRTAIGLLIIATLTNIFDSLAISTSYQLVVKGCIVVGAVALDVYARSLRT